MILKVVVLLAVVYLGGFLVLNFKKGMKKGHQYLLTFSGAFLIGMVFLHLLPEIFHRESHGIGWWILGGFLLQVFLEYLSQGIEHGHQHTHPGQSFPIMIFVSLCLHALIEAMPLGGVHDHGSFMDQLLIGLAVHKLPVSMVLATMLFKSGKKVGGMFLMLTVFALMAPLGMFLYQLLESQDIMAGSALFQRTNALLVGILLHISTTILFESEDGHRFNLLKFLVILLGFALSSIHFH